MAAESITFWLAAAAMVAAALAIVLPRLSGRSASMRDASRDALNAAVYRAELAALEEERRAGTLAPAEYERACTELKRRLLDDVPVAGTRREGVRARGTLAIALALPVLAFALYMLFGTPSALVSTADRDAAPSGATLAEFRAQLVAHLARNASDGRAWVALARLEMDEGRYDDASRHYAKALEASPKVARDAGVLCEYADALGMAQGGRLEGPPARLIDRALALDGAHPRALEMAGSAAYERRDFRGAVRHWRALLGQLAEESASHRELAAAVARAERLAATSLPADAVDGAVARGR